MNDCRHISVHVHSNEFSTTKFKCNLSRALAEGERSKDIVDQRASVSPNQDGVCCQIFSTSKAILKREVRAH